MSSPSIVEMPVSMKSLDMLLDAGFIGSPFMSRFSS